MVLLFLSQGWYEAEAQGVTLPLYYVRITHPQPPTSHSFSFPKPTTHFRDKDDQPHPRSTNTMDIFKEVPRDLHYFLLALFYRDSPTQMGTPMEANERRYINKCWWVVDQPLILTNTTLQQITRKVTHKAQYCPQVLTVCLSLLGLPLPGQASPTLVWK